MNTKIEWCGETINPIQDTRKGKSGRGYHCTKCSPGCENCYAERINKIRGNGLPFDDSPVEFELIQSELDKLSRWRKGRSVFVQSMGDLFHPAVSQSIIDEIFDAFWHHPQHTHLILTKRPADMNNYLCTLPEEVGLMPNLYRGLTVSTQREWDEKGPIFMQIPGRKFISHEPALETIDFHLSGKQSDVIWRRVHGGSYERSFLAGIIAGGETGAGARPSHPNIFRSDRNQCEAAGVPFFFKSWGEWGPVTYYAAKSCDHPTLPTHMTDNVDVVALKDSDFKDWYTKMGRITKKLSGRLLDGREHNGLPWRI
ncbi:hypothetical protein ES708_03959 [subsurface metagenome]